MSAWVQPMIYEIRKTLPQARIIIALVPCPHSSGQEQAYTQRFYGASVLKPQETVHYLLSGKLPKHIVLARHGVVLHLGGDQLFSVGLGWRSHFPVTVYTEKLVQWKSQVRRYYFRDRHQEQAQRKHLPEQKRKWVGDLMVDAVKTADHSVSIRQKLNLRLDAPVISLLPGSKPLKVLNTTAFLLKIVDELSLELPQAQFILPQSSFTPLSELRQAVQDPRYLAVLDGSPGKVVHDRNSTSLITPQGNKVQIVPPNWNYAALQVSDLALTLPGTNTAELAVLGIPMLVLLPLKRPELLPLDGLASWIEHIPFIGRRLKAYLVRQRLAGIDFLALPNQKAGAALVPELIGNFTASDVANKAMEMLRDPYHLRETSLQLREIMGNDHAAQQIVVDLIDILQRNDPRFSHLVARSNDYSIPEDSDSRSQLPPT